MGDDFCASLAVFDNFADVAFVAAGRSRFLARGVAPLCAPRRLVK